MDWMNHLALRMEIPVRITRRENLRNGKTVHAYNNLIKGRSKSKLNFFQKQSFKPVSVYAPVSESTCIALHKPTKQTREPITQSKQPVWLSKLPLINGPEPLILNHTDNNLTRSRSHRTPFRKRPQKKLHPY